MKLLKQLLCCSVATPLHIIVCLCSRSFAFHAVQGSSSSRSTCMVLQSLKPAAVPLLDSGKALARCGEVLIEYTTSLDIYGGALSATGASLRNAGDCVAQAAASCRFKTGAELVSDELREAATCIMEGTKLLPRAVQEARDDKDEIMALILEATVQPMLETGVALEAAGASIMQRVPQQIVGQQFVTGGNSLRSLSELILELPPLSTKSAAKGNDRNSTIILVKLCSQRMQYAALKMIEAGNLLLGVEKDATKGRAFLKGGM